MLITEQQPIKYVVFVGGMAVSGPLPSRQLAEATIFQLPKEQQTIAEVRVVNSTGAELLLG